MAGVSERHFAPRKKTHSSFVLVAIRSSDDVFSRGKCLTQHYAVTVICLAVFPEPGGESIELPR